jgi:N-acetylneuraminic acid mutarotase
MCKRPFHRVWAKITRCTRPQGISARPQKSSPPACWSPLIVMAFGIALALQLAAAPAIAQSIASDNKPRPGSPTTGWSGNFSPSDPFSEGPGMGAWITKAGLIHSRSEVAVGEVNGKMYVLGGYADGNVAQPLNEEYDPARDEWRERAPLPRGGNHIAAVGLGGKLYAIGGFSEQNANAFADVSVYDPATDKWASAAPLPQPLGSMAVVAVDGVIHALGGATGDTADNRHTIAVHYIYDPKTDKWTESVPLPFPREHFNVLYLNGKLYAIAGRIGNYSQNLQTILTLDMHQKDAQWQENLPLMPTARSGTQAAILDGKIFVFGGEKFGGVFNNNEMFDPATERWSELTRMPVGRHGTGAVVFNHMIFIPAGGPLNGGEAQTNANQAFVYP